MVTFQHVTVVLTMANGTSGFSGEAGSGLEDV